MKTFWTCHTPGRVIHQSKVKVLFSLLDSTLKLSQSYCSNTTHPLNFASTFRAKKNQKGLKKKKKTGPDWDVSCYHSFHFIWAKSQTSARHQYTLFLWRQVPWFDRVWASIWSGLSGASRRGTTCDKWVLSGGCGVGKPTLFPCDYISRQENETQWEWLEFHTARGRRAFSLVCRLIKAAGGDGLDTLRAPMSIVHCDCGVRCSDTRASLFKWCQ